MPPLTSEIASSASRWRVPLIVLAASVAAVGLFIIVGAAIAFFVVGADAIEITQRQRVILYKTNPNTVLAACATIRANRGVFRNDPDWHNQPVGGDTPDPADPKMPPVIATLRPCSIRILPEGVQIELGGGFYHYGLAEQLPGAAQPAFAVKQLAPGLCYYAEDGKAPPP